MDPRQWKNTASGSKRLVTMSPDTGYRQSGLLDLEHCAVIVGAAEIRRAVQPALDSDQAGVGVLAVPSASEGMEHGFGSGRRVEREHGALVIGAASLRSAVQISLHIDQAGHGRYAVGSATERIEHCFRTSHRVEREHGAVVIGAAKSRCAIQRALDIDQISLRELAVGSAAEGMEHCFRTGHRIEREHRSITVGALYLRRTVERTFHVD